MKHPDIGNQSDAFGADAERDLALASIDDVIATAEARGVAQFNTWRLASALQEYRTLASNRLRQEAEEANQKNFGADPWPVRRNVSEDWGTFSYRMDGKQLALSRYLHLLGGGGIPFPMDSELGQMAPRVVIDFSGPDIQTLSLLYTHAPTIGFTTYPARIKRWASPEMASVLRKVEALGRRNVINEIDMTNLPLGLTVRFGSNQALPEIHAVYAMPDDVKSGNFGSYEQLIDPLLADSHRQLMPKGRVVDIRLEYRAARDVFVMDSPSSDLNQSGSNRAAPLVATAQELQNTVADTLQLIPFLKDAINPFSVIDIKL